MILFSPKARRLIDAAVSQFGDAGQRDLWRQWAEAHPGTRQASGPPDDGGPPIPETVVAIALWALSAMEIGMSRQSTRGSCSDDEAIHRTNTIEYIRSIEAALRPDADAPSR